MNDTFTFRHIGNSETLYEGRRMMFRGADGQLIDKVIVSWPANSPYGNGQAGSIEYFTDDATVALANGTWTILGEVA